MSLFLIIEKVNNSIGQILAYLFGLLLAGRASLGVQLLGPVSDGSNELCSGDSARRINQSVPLR